MKPKPTNSETNAGKNASGSLPLSAISEFRLEPDPEVSMQEHGDWFATLVLALFTYGPAILLGAFYAAITSTTAIVIIYHLSR